MKNKHSFSRYMQTVGILFLLGFGGAGIGVDLFYIYRDLDKRVDEIRTEYVDRQKETVRQEVLRVADMVRIKQSQSEQLTREKIRSRVDEAVAVARNIYRENRGTESGTRIGEMIREALRPVRFEGGTGYYFATRMDGVEMLFADRPELEGRDLLGMRDTRGRYVIRDMIDIAQRSGEGFYEYHWTKPDSEGSDFKKISFIRRFEPLDWFIGTGLYVDDVESRIKADLLRDISRMRFGQEGYLFVNRLDGDALVSNGRVFSGEQKLWEVFGEDPRKMREIFEKEYRAAMEPEGGFIRYSHVKLSDPETQFPKISFVYGLRDLGWLIGAGVYLDDMEGNIARLRAALDHQVRVRVLYFILTGLVIAALFLLFFSWLNYRLKSDVALFISFFQRAAQSDEEVDRASIKFAELDQMAAYANKMLADRILAERALRQSEVRFRELSEMLPEAVFEADLDMNLTFVNRQACSMFGYDDRDFEKGMNACEMFVPEDRERVRENVRKRRWGEQAGANEYRGLKKDGTVFPVLFRSGPVLDNDAVVGMRCVVVDITERKKLEERIVESQKMESIGNLAGGIAHDFNNLLFPIVGMAEMLLEDLSPDSVEYESAQEILKAGRRASDLVKQILAFSRQSEHQTMPVRPQKIIAEVVKLTRSTIPANIPIHEDLDSGCGPVHADPTQIHQVAMNLITNAYHAVEPRNGEIRVAVRETDLEERDLPDGFLAPGRYALISVSDTGGGIDPAILDRIFDPYFTTKEKGKGTGLGLSVVYGIIKEHGGDVEVKSDPGRGATFNVYLPLIADGDEPELPVSTEVLPSGNERILLVDDEEAIVVLEKRILERLGYRITFRLDSLEAVEAFRANPEAYDLVITDMTMPHMTGDRLAERLIEIRPDIPVVVCTGFSERIDAARAAAIGVRGLLMKPLVRSDLARVVRNVLDGLDGLDAPGGR